MQQPRLVWFLLAVGLAALLFFVPPLNQSTKAAVWRLLGIPTDHADNLGSQTRSLIDGIRSIRTLHDEVIRLGEENLQLRAELTRRAEVDHQNELLRAELEFAHDYRDSFAIEPVAIIARDPATALQRVTVNRGARDGVQVTQVAMSQGFLIGRISAVTETTATLELITASRSRLPATLATSRAIGIVEGGLAGLMITELPADVAVTEGEPIVTAGLGELVPNGLPIGTIEHRLSPAGAFVQEFSVRSPIDFTKLELVMLLQPKR